jgi:iron complex outermembrane receptor protein
MAIDREWDMETRKTALLASAALLTLSGLMFSGRAQAQDTPADNDSDTEIVVTAQKREQTLIDVPQSISVVSGDRLQRLQATSFEDYVKQVPGLQLVQDTPGVGRLVLRGINTGGVAATVAVYLDETPFGSSSGLANGAIMAGDFDTFDVARVEVLRGPQGTLYGASSLGGVLKFVPNAPDTAAFSAKGKIGAATTKGGDASYSGNAVVNVPLGDTLALRASGYYRKTGGFIDSIGNGGSDVEENINDSASYGGRAALLFKPSANFTLNLSALAQNIDVDADSSVESNPNTLKTLYGRPTLSQFVPSFTNVSYRVFNATASLDLGFANLTSSSSYNTQKQHFRTDSTFNLSGLIEAVFGTPNNLFLGQHTNIKKFTQELRLASTGESVVDWLVGGFFTDEKGLIAQQYIAVKPNTLTPITTLPLLADVSLNSKYREYAGFANATLHLGDRFDLDFGGRYSHNKQSALQITDGALAGGANTFPVARSSEGVFTYSVSPKVKFGEDASLYARVAKGFRPGGPNVLPPGAPGNVPKTYNSDSLISYETGLKMQTADGSFGLDLSVFHIDWSNIQLFAVVNNYGINVNGVGAKSDGAEFTARLRPTRGFDISINGAYTNARLTGNTDPLVGGRKGDKLPFNPKYSANVNADYEWALAENTKAFLGGSLSFLAKQAGAFDNDFRTANGRQRQLPSYTVIDLRAGVDFGKFTVEAYAKNLGDSEGKTSTSAVNANGMPVYPNGAIGTGVIRPRTLGLSVTAGF